MLQGLLCQSVQGVMNAMNGQEVKPGPTDSVSELAFSPASDFLAASSWDNQLRIYQVDGTNAIAKYSTSHEQPALSCCFSKDGMKAFSGGADKQVKVLDMSTGQAMGFQAHSDAVKSVKWMDSPTHQALITASWDKTIKYWDLRSSQPIATVNLPDRVFAMDAQFPLLAVALADRQICTINLTNPTVIQKTDTSPLKFQTRSISVFPNGSGYAVGSIEGRVGIQDEKISSNSFAFKCHRIDTNIFSVNSLCFHSSGSLASLGSDGTWNFWDKDSRQKLKGGPQLNSPCTAGAFNRHGNVFAYATGYDWSKGYDLGAINSAKTGIYLLACSDSDVKPKNSLLRRR